MSGAVCVIENDPTIKSIDKFIKLVTAANDLRRTTILGARCVIGRNLLQVSNDHIENVCSTIIQKKSSELHRTEMSLENNFYGAGLTRINREKFESTFSQPADNCLRKRRTKKNSARVISRMCLHQQLLHSAVEWTNADERSWDEEIMTHNQAIYYNGMLLSEITNYLEAPVRKCLSQIHPKLNRDVDRMPGINTSMFYLGCTGSYSEMHIEDANLDSINVVHFNLDPERSAKTSKIWIIVPDKELLYEKSLYNYENTEKSSPNATTCCHFLDHKRCYVSLEFLKKYKIRYHIVKQKPGDVIYLKPGVFHQVININTNFAEAINFGSLEWNCGNCMSSTCKCTGLSQLQHIHPNSQMVHKVVARHVKMYACIVDGCAFDTPRQNDWGKHLQNEHNIERPFECKKCDRKYLTLNHLTSHNCPKGDGSKLSFCRVCNMKVSKLPKHYKTQRHVQNVSNNANASSNITELGLNVTKEMCPKCEKDIRKSRHAKHVKTCRAISCPQCKNKFYCKDSLQRHQTKCQVTVQ